MQKRRFAYEDGSRFKSTAICEKEKFENVSPLQHYGSDRDAVAVFFNIVPMFGIVIAFEDYNPTQGLWGSEFVGLEHFEYLFSMSDSRRVIVNTLVIAVSKLVLNIVVPLAFALLLNEVRKLRFKKFVQTVVYLPHFLSWVILASVLLEIFGYRGVFNSLLSVFGIEGKIWFSEESCFRQLVIFSDVWKEFGFNAVIYLAALTGISPPVRGGGNRRMRQAEGCLVYHTAGHCQYDRGHGNSGTWQRTERRFRPDFQSVQPAGILHRRYSGHMGLPDGTSERTVFAGDSGGTVQISDQFSADCHIVCDRV